MNYDICFPLYLLFINDHDHPKINRKDQKEKGPFVTDRKLQYTSWDSPSKFCSRQIILLLLVSKKKQLLTSAHRTTAAEASLKQNMFDCWLFDCCTLTFLL
jgi:hypothetical protein